MTFLTTSPLWLSVIVLVIIPTLLAMMGTVLARRIVGLEKLSTNNEVAGFKFATVGVLYAVLLAFAVIVVWENYSETDSEIAGEAGAVATLYRLADGMEGDAGPGLRNTLTAYLETTINQEWAAMERGKESPAAVRALSAMYAAALGYKPTDHRGAALLSQVLHQLNLVAEGRRARLVKSGGIVPHIVWLVLFGGAAVTIGFTFFFGASDLRAQSLMTGALSLLIFSGLLVIVAFDRPFAGAIKVEPEPLVLVLEDFGRGSAARP